MPETIIKSAHGRRYGLGDSNEQSDRPAIPWCGSLHFRTGRQDVHGKLARHSETGNHQLRSTPAGSLLQQSATVPALCADTETATKVTCTSGYDTFVQSTIGLRLSSFLFRGTARC